MDLRMARGVSSSVLSMGQRESGHPPEAIVVEVPEYCGPAFYPEEPKWVPILPMFSKKEGTHMTRLQFPVVAGFAITVNKAQGLTIKEGVVIHSVGGKKVQAGCKTRTALRGPDAVRKLRHDCV